MFKKKKESKENESSFFFRTLRVHFLKVLHLGPKTLDFDITLRHWLQPALFSSGTSASMTLMRASWYSRSDSL